MLAVLGGFNLLETVPSTINQICRKAGGAEIFSETFVRRVKLSIALFCGIQWGMRADATQSRKERFSIVRPLATDVTTKYKTLCQPQNISKHFIRTAPHAEVHKEAIRLIGLYHL